VTHLLLDTSVLVKWLHHEDEGELVEAFALRRAHVSGQVSAHVTDLAIFEIGNVLLRALRWDADDVADQLDDLHVILGPPLAVTRSAHRVAAGLAAAHRLTFYDASWAAMAQELGIPLVSADRDLLRAGLADSATATVTRLRLPVE
jgi:predicted nucleic acid-binding protein